MTAMDSDYVDDDDWLEVGRYNVPGGRLVIQHNTETAMFRLVRVETVITLIRRLESESAQAALMTGLVTALEENDATGPNFDKTS